MLLLGVLQEQAISVGPVGEVGSYDLLATEILTSSQASVTFSGLSAYASTYQHLQIRGVSRRTDNNGGTTYVRFNGDSSSNYSTHYLLSVPTSVISGASLSDKIIIGQEANNASPSGAYGAIVTDILDAFETTKYKTTRSLTGTTTLDNRIGLISGSWRNTASLTSITIFPELGQVASGSRFSLYGLRSA